MRPIYNMIEKNSETQFLKQPNVKGWDWKIQ
jgi:hypothetical protein